MAGGGISSALATELSSRTTPEHDLDVVMTGSRALVGVAVRTLGLALGEVTLPQFRTLALLRRDGPLRVRDIAEELDRQPSGVTRMADRLEASGYLVRSPSPDSRREVLLSLTPLGEDLVREALTRRRLELGAILQQLDPDERAALSVGLAALARVAHEYTDDAVLLGL